MPPVVGFRLRLPLETRPPSRHQLVDVETGEIRTAVSVESVLAEYGERIESAFQSREISLFFPIVSPDEKKVFFKLARPSGGDNYRSKNASFRLGLVAYDLEHSRFVRFDNCRRHWDVQV